MKNLINSTPIQQEEVWREITRSIFPDIVYKCSFTFKGEYDIDMINLDLLMIKDKIDLNILIVILA